MYKSCHETTFTLEQIFFYSSDIKGHVQIRLKSIGNDYVNIDTRYKHHYVIPNHLTYDKNFFLIDNISFNNISALPVDNNLP